MAETQLYGSSDSCPLCYFILEQYHSFECLWISDVNCKLFAHKSSQSALDAMEKRNSALEVKLVEAQKEGSHTVEKLQDVEQKCSKLQQNVKRCSSSI